MTKRIQDSRKWSKKNNTFQFVQTTLAIHVHCTGTMMDWRTHDVECSEQRSFCAHVAVANHSLQVKQLKEVSNFQEVVYRVYIHLLKRSSLSFKKLSQ